jgi:hypothetical protein
MYANAVQNMPIHSTLNQADEDTGCGDHVNAASGRSVAAAKN